MLFILDPAPAQKLRPELLKIVDVLTPNETEAQILTDIEVTDEESAHTAAKKLLDYGVKSVILTLGSKGFVLADNDRMEFVSSVKVDAVDTSIDSSGTRPIKISINGVNVFSLDSSGNLVVIGTITQEGTV